MYLLGRKILDALEGASAESRAKLAIYCLALLTRRWQKVLVRRVLRIDPYEELSERNRYRRGDPACMAPNCGIFEFVRLMDYGA